MLIKIRCPNTLTVMINLSIAQNMIAMYQRDLHLRFYRSANIQEQKKGGKKKDALRLLEALTPLQVKKRHIP